MKAAQIQRLVRHHLLPSLPGFTAKGALLYSAPLDYLLRGFYFEPSGTDPAAFYLWAFIQPLYVPASHVYFTFGKRLESGWTIGGNEAGSDQSNGQHTQPGTTAVMARLLRTIEAEGLPFLDNIERPVDLAYRSQQVSDAPDDPYVVEAVIYSLVLAGEYDRTQEEYARLKRSLSALDQEPAWPREIAQRAAQVMDNLPHHPDDALALLITWTRQTARDLRLPEPQLAQRQFAGAI